MSEENINNEDIGTKVNESLKDDVVDTMQETLTLKKESAETEEKLETLKLEEGIVLEPINLEDIEKDQLKAECQFELEQQIKDHELEEKELEEKSSKLIQDINIVKKPFKIDDKELKSLYGRLADFLPKIKEANKDLEKL